MLSVVKMLLKRKVGGCALNSHGNYIVDHVKSWNCVFEFLWEPCKNFIHLCVFADWEIKVNLRVAAVFL